MHAAILLPGRARWKRWHSALTLLALVASLGAIHLWWLARFRRGFPLDIDESGYLWYSFVLHDVLREDGILGLWHRVQGEGWAGPLFPAVTAILELPAGAGDIVTSMATQLVFLALLVVASYGIGCRLLDERAGLLTALVVATTPATLDFVRTYQLVIPSTAMYAVATYALLASDRLRRRPWAVAWGVALGLTLLSRTMIVAFLPALPLAAGWMLAVDRAERRRVVNLCLGLLALVGVAALWYATSWSEIFDYLLGFGYGSDSPSGGGVPSLLSPSFWADELQGAIELAFYVPLAAVLLAATVAAALAWGEGLAHATSLRAALRERAAAAARSDAIVPAFVIAEGYLALTSSSNDGTGFVVPLLPSLVALVVVATLRVPWRRARVTLVAALCLVCAFDVVMKADVVSGVSRVRSVTLPLLGRTTLTNGRGFIHQHLVNDACYELGPPTRWLPESERGWLPLLASAVAPLAEVHPRGREARLFLSQSEPLLNPGSLRLAAYREGIRGGVFGLVDTGRVDTVAAYEDALGAARPDLVLTASAERCHFGPAVTPGRVETAAAALGYTLVERLPTPDRRELRVWAAPQA